EERVVERAGRVDRILDLLGRAPTLGRPLLEQAERVAVAVVDVGDVGLLIRRGERHRDGPRGYVAGQPDRGDRGRVFGLVQGEDGGVPVDGGAALRRPPERAVRAAGPVDEQRGGATAENDDGQGSGQKASGATHAHSSTFGVAGLVPCWPVMPAQFACNAAFSPPQSPDRASASTVPVTLLRR